MEARDFIVGYENDIKELQMKLVEIEKEKSAIQKELRLTELYRRRTEKTREIRQLRELIEARTRELHGAKKLLQMLSKKQSQPRGKVISMGM